MPRLNLSSNRSSQPRTASRVLTAALGLLPAAIVAVAVASAPPAQASLVMALELPELVARSQHIAVVDVISTRAEWDEAHERILTTIVLSVVESWKGPAAPAERITVVQPGGTVGDISMVVFGMSQFQVGERSVVFLRGTMAAAAVVGMAQGKRAVRRDEAGRWMADAPDQRGTVFLRPATASTPPSTPPSTSSAPPGPAVATPANDLSASTFRRRTLDQFRLDVQGILKAAAK